MVEHAVVRVERLSPLVGSGDAAWAVGHAQQALLSAELSCWPPTLVFKSSSVFWYFFECWSQKTEIYASFFYFFQPFGQCALKPFICSLFFPWAYAVLTLLMIFAPICTKLCFPFGLSETAVSPSSGIFKTGL